MDNIVGEGGIDIDKGKLTLVYWNTKGLGETVKVLLEYCGVQYNTVLLTSDQQWYPYKDYLQTIGFEFPNLPFILDKGKYLSETNAIMCYIASISGKEYLLPSRDNFVEYMKIYNMIEDLYSALASPVYLSRTRQELVESLGQSIDNHIYTITSICRTVNAHNWILGKHNEGRISLPDFRLAYLLEKVVEFCEELPELVKEEAVVTCDDGTVVRSLSTYHIESMRTYIHRFASIESISSYRVNSKYHEQPMHAGDTYWRE